jgi:uncharacterized protein
LQHQSHPAIIKRLKRAEGHLRALIIMMEAEKPCLELAQQLHAIEHAVANAKKELIHDHIDHCLNGAITKDPRTSRGALAEFKALSKYL